MSHNFGQKEESHLDRFLSREKEHQRQEKEESVRRAVAELNRPKKKSVGEYVREAREKARERGRVRDVRAKQRIKYAARHPGETFYTASRKISTATNAFEVAVNKTPAARNVVYRGRFIEPIVSRSYGGGGDFLNSGSLFTSERRSKKSRRKVKSIFDL